MTKPTGVPRPVKAATKTAKVAPVENWPADPTTAARMRATSDFTHLGLRERERQVRADAKVNRAMQALNIVEHEGKNYYKPRAAQAMNAHFALQRSAKFLPAIPGLFDLMAAAHKGAAQEGRALCSRHDVAPLIHVFAGHPRAEWESRSQPIDYAMGAQDDEQKMGSEFAAQVITVAGEYGLDWAQFSSTPWREIKAALETTVWFCLGTPHCEGDRPGVICVDVALFCGLGVGVPGTSVLTGSWWDEVPVVISELARRDAAVRTFVELVHLAGHGLPMSDGIVALTVALAGPKRWNRLAGHHRVVWADLNGRGSLHRVASESAFETPEARSLSTWEALLSWTRENVGSDERSDSFRHLLGGSAGFAPPRVKSEMEIINERLTAAEQRNNRLRDSGSFADRDVEVATASSLVRDSTVPRISSVLDGLSR